MPGAAVLLTVAMLGQGPVASAKLAWEDGSKGKARAQKITLNDKHEGSVELGPERKLRVRMDEKLTQLWVDDQKPVAVKPPGQAWEHTCKIGEAQVTFYRNANCSRDHVHFYPRAYRSGTLVLAKRLRPVAVSDGNADVQFADPKHDAVLLDFDGDGRLDAKWERVAPGEPFLLRGKSYVAKVPPDGGVVELHAAENGKPRPPRPWTSARLAAPPKDDRKFEELLKIVDDRKQPAADRIAAIKAMGGKQHAKYAAAIAGIAKTADHVELRAQALVALHLHQYAKREILFHNALLRGESREVWAGSAGLVLMGRKDAVEHVVRSAGGRGSARTIQAYQSLRYLKDGPSLEMMRTAARDETASVRGYGIDDMTKHGLPEARTHALLATRVRPVQLGLGRSIAHALGRAGDPEAVDALLKMAPEAPSRLLADFRRELGPIRDPEVTARFVAGLKSPAAPVRALCASLLGALPERATTDALAKQVKREKDPEALEAVLGALGEHADPNTVSILLAAARKKDPALRAAAMRALSRLSGLPEVRKLFVKLLNAPSWADRVHALDAMNDVNDPKVLTKITASLNHKAWQVRHAGANCLGRMRVREGIAPMIRRLEREDVKRVRAALADALWRTTGMQFYDFADTWKRWWTERGASFEVPAEPPKKRPKRKGGSVASFYGLPLDSDRVVFVIDQSGSMSASDRTTRLTRMQTAVSEVLGAIGRLKSKDKVNVIFFETSIHPWRPKITALSKGNRAQLEQHLRAQRPKGGTNLYDGLELALRDKQADTIFLLSDGQPGSGKYVVATDILRGVRHLNRARRIAIHCVSVGTDSDLLRKLAAQNWGQYVRR